MTCGIILKGGFVLPVSSLAKPDPVCWHVRDWLHQVNQQVAVAIRGVVATWQSTKVNL